MGHANDRAHATSLTGKGMGEERCQDFPRVQKVRAHDEVTQQHLAFLAEASRVLASSLDYETTLASIVRLAVPTLADWCVVDLLGQDNTIQRVAVAHVDPQQEVLACEMWRRYPSTLEHASIIAGVLHTGKAVIVSDIDLAHFQSVARDSTHLQMLLQLHPRCDMCVPLMARGRTLGAISFRSIQSGQRYGPDDLVLAENLAHRAALAVDNARLYKELQESEEKYRALFTESKDAILIRAPDGQCLDVNHAALTLFGYTRDEMLYLAPHTLYTHPGEWERYRRELAANGFLRDYAVQLRRKDGTTLDCVITASVWQAADGRVQGYQAILRDVTAQKRLEAQLRQAQKMEAIGTLAGGIAHDFNNILSVILGYTELARLDVAQSSQAQHSLQAVLTAANRAKDLVRQILAFSRQGEQKHRPVQLHLLVKEALQLLRASLPATIAIQHHLPTTSDLVMANPTQIHQVLMNLGSNAEYAMRETGGVLDVRLETVTVSADIAAAHPPLHAGPHLRLIVRDTGCGMERAILERVFEPFFTTKGVGEGTGLGLAVVHGIITSYGGAITVESQPGQGTTFTIYLPRIESLAHGEAPLQEPLLYGTEHILFVDDEEALALLGHEMLTSLGYNVVVCTSSAEALETFRTAPQRFDLVITDQTMPGMTGVMLAQELLRIRPEIPIILCTGFSHTVTAEKAQGLGIRAYLTKPIMMRDLGLAIRRVLPT